VLYYVFLLRIYTGGDLLVFNAREFLGGTIVLKSRA